MQSNDMAEKIKVIIEGIERKDFVSINELDASKGIVDVPEFARKRHIADGVINIPTLECTFKVQRDSDTIEYFRKWHFENQVKDLIKVRLDGHGVEFGRTLYTLCECAGYKEPAYDGLSPSWAKVTVTLVPYDMVVIS